jgi:hypothetical protein
MKRIILGLTLLISVPCYTNKPIYLESGLLSLVDGTEFIGIAEIFNFAGNLLGLLHGLHIKTAYDLQKTFNLKFPEPLENYANEKGRVGLIWYQDGYTTIKAMLKEEQEHPNSPDVASALNHGCHHFEKLSEDYEAEIKAAKDIMLKIISNWAELRERPDSLMLAWANIDEGDHGSLYRTMTSFAIFDKFLDDLLLFLKDLIQNCPKSHKAYREQLKK